MVRSHYKIMKTYLYLMILSIMLAILISFSPMLGLIITFIGVIIFVWIFAHMYMISLNHVDLLSPLVFFPPIYILFYGIGSLNILPLRSFVNYSQVLPIQLLGLGGYLLGAILQRPSYSLKEVEEMHGGAWDPKVAKKYGILLLSIGVVIYGIVLLTYGIPLLKNRFGLSGYLSYFAHLLWIGAVFYATSFFITYKRLSLQGWLIVAFTVILQLSLGYRSQVLMFLMLLFFLYYYLVNPTFKVVFCISFLALILTSFLWTLRHMLGEGASLEYFIKSYNLEYWQLPLFALYLIPRESTSLLYRSVEYLTNGGSYLSGKLFVQDFLTILPGKQISGGGLVAELLGGTGRAGLTPSILGGLILDFGWPGIFGGLSMIGFLLGYFHRKMRRRPSQTNVLIYTVLVMISLNFLRRGVFTPLYIYLPTIFILVSKAIERRSPEDNK